MAHARLCGLFRNAGLAMATVDGPLELAVLAAADAELLRALTEFPDVVQRAARDHEPHRVTTYLEALARQVHGWYHGCRVLGEPAPVERARLLLARAAAQVLANGLTLLGITSPDRI